MAETKSELIVRSIFRRNPIALLVLGICSALAVTGQMATAFVMSICVPHRSSNRRGGIGRMVGQRPGNLCFGGELLAHRRN